MWTRIVRSAVTVTTVLAATLSAGSARADHDRGEWREGWRGEGIVPRPAPVLVRPSPPLSAPAPPVFARHSWRAARWDAERRFGELRHEYRALAIARDRFYATWDGRPWARDRFEGWYAARRADLDARAAELWRWWR
jgi:hypothetical protein